jgi:hypothetical protein
MPFVVFDVVVVVVLPPGAIVVVVVFDVMLPSAGIGAFMSGAMVSFDIIVPLSAGALAVLLAAVPPQAETRMAAPAIVAMERMLRMKRSP